MSAITTSTYADVGPMVCGSDIEAAVLDTLRAWLPAYLAEAERQHGLEAGRTPAPRSWSITGRDLQKLNSDQLPCIVLMSTGIVTPPTKQGVPGALTAFWTLAVGIVFSAAWGRSARHLAQLYVGAIRTCLLQRPLEGALKGFLDFRGEQYNEMDFADSRTYSSGFCEFLVEIPDIGWTAGGPPAPAEPPIDPTEPFIPWVPVTGSDVTVDAQPVNQPVTPSQPSEDE